MGKGGCEGCRALYSTEMNLTYIRATEIGKLQSVEWEAAQTYLPSNPKTALAVLKLMCFASLVTLR